MAVWPLRTLADRLWTKTMTVVLKERLKLVAMPVPTSYRCCALLVITGMSYQIMFNRGRRGGLQLKYDPAGLRVVI